MIYFILACFWSTYSVALGVLLTNRLNQFRSKRILLIIQDVLDSYSIFIADSKIEAT